ncbi:hypothetical protein BH18PSE1_BH18PSE1_07150 [soil metagenome]
MNALTARRQVEPTPAELARLLSHRFGDGSIYLPAGVPRQVFFLATQLGYISEDGYLTRKGRDLLSRYHVD